MLRVLLVFIAISIACCQTTCPGFSDYNHDSILKSELYGTFYLIYTSVTPVLKCEKSTWTIVENNVISARVESPGCCMQIDHFDESNLTTIHYNVNPITGACVWKYTTNATMKLIAKTGSGASLCLIVAVCDEPRNGLLVACRQKTPDSLLSTLSNILSNLLGAALSFLKIVSLRPVNQLNCEFESGNCSA